MGTDARNELLLRLGLLKREIHAVEENLGLSRPLAGSGIPPASGDSAHQLIVELSADLISIHEANGDYIWVSPNCEGLFGWRQEQLVGHSAYELFHPEDVRRIAEDHSRHGTGAAGAVRYRLRCGSGAYRWVETRSKASSDGHYIVAITRDVQVEQDLLAKLERQAFRDVLTELPNRHALEEALDRELSRSLRSGKAFSLLLLDLDHFKEINDTRGHDAGDDYLRQVAGRLEGLRRSYDVVGRWGGDEFLVVLPEAAADAASRVGERVRRVVAEIGTGSSLSIGISSTASARSRRELLLQADAALYQAKAAGGDQVVVWRHSLPWHAGEAAEARHLQS